MEWTVDHQKGRQKLWVLLGFHLCFFRVRITNLIGIGLKMGEYEQNKYAHNFEILHGIFRISVEMNFYLSLQIAIILSCWEADNLVDDNNVK